MTGPGPALATVRLAVRRGLDDPGHTALVACSGGADSLALLTASVFEGHKLGLRVVGVVVDHGLQDRSAEHTERVVAQMVGLGVDETASIRVTVHPGGRGVEAAAREARYAALAELAQHFDAGVVLLGHTRDDQAETVLLGLTRGSGTRALAGMRPRFEVFRRPLLQLSRAQTEAACVEAGLRWWSDPHNDDPRFTRPRVRHEVLPVLERELGPGVAAALARTAAQARADADLLDELARTALSELSAQVAAFSAGPSTRPALPIEGLTDLPAALRTRVLRAAAVQAGAIGAELFFDHVRELDRLVTDWHGQKGVDLPGHLRAVREGTVLSFISGFISDDIR